MDEIKYNLDHDILVSESNKNGDNRIFVVNIKLDYQLSTSEKRYEYNDNVSASMYDVATFLKNKNENGGNIPSFKFTERDIALAIVEMYRKEIYTVCLPSLDALKLELLEVM